MPRILLPGKDGALPKECEGRRAPVGRGSYFEFEISQDEFKFWKLISNEEREKLRLEAYSRCFYDVLKDYMQNHPKAKSTNIFGRSSSS